MPSNRLCCKKKLWAKLCRNIHPLHTEIFIHCHRFIDDKKIHQIKNWSMLLNIPHINSFVACDQRPQPTNRRRSNFVLLLTRYDCSLWLKMFVIFFICKSDPWFLSTICSCHCIRKYNQFGDLEFGLAFSKGHSTI